MTSKDNLLQTLQRLEPKFIEAGKLALKMQNGVGRRNKYSTGNPNVDIVTDADLRLQELLLKEIAATDLANCHLLAEENTPLVKDFRKQGEFYLGIDPIDGTKIYSEGGKFFSTIISLHDGKKILYMFGYYPAFDWYYKVVDNVYSDFGKIPDSAFPADLMNTIIYRSGDPGANIPGHLYKDLKDKGLRFREATLIAKDYDTITMIALDKIAGFYTQDPNVYDGMAEYSVAHAKGWKVYSGNHTGKLDLSSFKKRESGFYYPGYYLAIK